MSTARDHTFPSLVMAVVLMASAISTPRTAMAQTPDATAPACLRFTFGTWTPALNWKGAGHTSTLDTSRIDRAPDGRAWAAPTERVAGDTVLVLYPLFWPAGISIAFNARKLLPNDTITATATAFVADARVPSPVARAQVWAVACR